MFDEIVTLWSHIDTNDEVYTAAVFLTNLHGLVYTNKVAHFYECPHEYGKLSVHEYLGLVFH
jgi:hypothetical protein